MKPVLLPAMERLGRRALLRRGITSRTVPTSYGDLHVYDAKGAGRLPTVVMFHGIASAATPFGPVLARLLPHVERVIAPDYPGHGFSPHRGTVTPEGLFEAMDEVLAKLAVERAILVGNSLGGAVALHCAVRKPDRVKGLVLVSPAGAHATAEEWTDIRRAFAVHSRADAKAFAKRLYFRVPWFLPVLAHEFPAVFARPAIRELLAAASNERLPSPESIRTLAMPILLLWGEAERLFPSTHLRYFEEHLPGHATIERPSGYGHCPHFDDPRDLARRIVAFARRIESS